MAKKEKDDTPRKLTPEIAATVDVMYRQSVQTLYATTDLGLEECLVKASQMISEGIIQKAEARDAHAPGPDRQDRIAPPPGTRVCVRRTMVDGTFGYGGRTLDRNQVFELTGLRNDAKLLDLGYLTVVRSDRPLETCGSCGAQFVDASSAAAHYSKRHEVKPKRVPVMEGRRPGETLQEYEERESAWRAQMLAEEHAADTKAERQLEADAPIYWENTAASRS